MTKYIDAEKLERFVERIGLTPQKSADYNDGRDDVKMMVLDFIDSLQQEQPEVDLERDAVQFCFDKGLNVTPYQAKTIANHFYELGRKQVLQEIYDGKTKPVDKITASWLDD